MDSRLVIALADLTFFFMFLGDSVDSRLLFLRWGEGGRKQFLGDSVDSRLASVYSKRSLSSCFWGIVWTAGQIIGQTHPP